MNVTEIATLLLTSVWTPLSRWIRIHATLSSVSSALLRWWFDMHYIFSLSAFLRIFAMANQHRQKEKDRGLHFYIFIGIFKLCLYWCLSFLHKWLKIEQLVLNLADLINERFAGNWSCFRLRIQSRARLVILAITRDLLQLCQKNLSPSAQKDRKMTNFM